MGAARFKLRRVLIGVVIGLVAVALSFYGWVQYRQSQYTDRERTVLTHYRNDFTLCLKLGNGELGCARHVLAACVRDPFWAQEKPFASAGTAAPDPLGRCSTKATTT
jgi:hypothetical protein